MAWRFELTSGARKDLSKLDRKTAQRILKFIYERITKRGNPRDVGESLKGSTLGYFWKYRVGDYRIIAKIEDGVLLVLIVSIGHRREVYKKILQ